MNRSFIYLHTDSFIHKVIGDNSTKATMVGASEMSTTAVTANITVLMFAKTIIKKGHSIRS